MPGTTWRPIGAHERFKTNICTRPAFHFLLLAENAAQKLSMLFLVAGVWPAPSVFVEEAFLQAASKVSPGEAALSAETQSEKKLGSILSLYLPEAPPFEFRIDPSHACRFFR
jgi:hypothetical protein